MEDRAICVSCEVGKPFSPSRTSLIVDQDVVGDQGALSPITPELVSVPGMPAPKLRCHELRRIKCVVMNSVVKSVSRVGHARALCAQVVVRAQVVASGSTRRLTLDEASEIPVPTEVPTPTSDSSELDLSAIHQDQRIAVQCAELGCSGWC